MLNLHETERTKPHRWTPFAWMPVYKDELAPKRPTRGYDSHTARRARLEHQALAYIFEDWDERTASAIKVVWGGKIERPTKLYLGAVVVDHPQLDKFTAGARN